MSLAEAIGPDQAVTLDDKYLSDEGRVYLTGTQALVRLALAQRRRDLDQGLNTAGFISGYRGSPLGGYDSELWRAKPHLEAHHVHFQPGVNEDLAATAVWGSQQLNLWPEANYDGVFGIWYGKGPGVDRSGDVLKHGNLNGSSRTGGVVALAGDDHGAKSSTLAHQSEPSFIAASIPVLNPAGVQELLDFGLHGFALSRYSGCWTGLKCVGDTVESSATVAVDPGRIVIRTPEDFELPPGGLSLRYPDLFLEQEARLLNFKVPAAQAYVRANGLDRIVFDAPNSKFGIASTGKAYLDLRQAFEELGLGEAELAALGIRVYKVALTWPLEPVAARAFADGLEEILVIEEKRGLIEDQLKHLLYNQANAPRAIIGKRDEEGRVILPENGEISPTMVARALMGRLNNRAERPEFEQRMARLDSIEATAGGEPARVLRSAFFCSGCPHNSSTKVPEGSLALAGIGCHSMAIWVPDRRTETISHMGGEGATWIGQAPFTAMNHVFVNLGDGTYHHSGLLAIRAAVAAQVNITYKILFNDAVAMTGGQPLDVNMTPWEISRQVHAEGVGKVVVVTDEPDKYPQGTDWAPGTTIHHRNDLDMVQRQLRDVAGVTALIYDQTCAAEKRRRRKRGTFPDPDRRVFINDLVCEGCGDCSVASNCISVEPLETEWGRKRRINQSACNKDFSCLNGFCPSFVTVEGATVRKAEPTAAETLPDLEAIPAPELPPTNEVYGIVVTGIGGTGVITIGALLAMAAHLEGKGATVLDETGLAQKNGAVMSHVRIADDLDALFTPRIGAGGARLLLGCDIAVATSTEALVTMVEGVSRAVVNEDFSPTAAFVLDQEIDLSTAPMAKHLVGAVGADGVDFVAASRLAAALIGDAIGANLFMVGYAYQKGLIPIGHEAILRAVELNGVAVAMNRRTFALGRLAAHEPETMAALVEPLMAEPVSPPVEDDLEAMIGRRADFLVGYQDEAYAERYRHAVERTARLERERAPGRRGLAELVAKNLFKLMAYKDEYEVARLYTSGDFETKLRRQFQGDFRVKLHLAPPLMSPRDPVSGRLIKREFGSWILPMMRLLAGFKHLRGGRFDPFGYTAERRMERRLIEEYRATMEAVASGLDVDNHAIACRIAEIPDMIRGFGHVKERNAKRADALKAELMAGFQDPAKRADAAE